MALLRDDVRLDAVILQQCAMPSVEFLELGLRANGSQSPDLDPGIESRWTGRDPTAGGRHHRVDESVRASAHQSFFGHPHNAFRDGAKWDWNYEK
jgi:hypothetical protein